MEEFESDILNRLDIIQNEFEELNKNLKVIADFFQNWPKSSEGIPGITVDD